ncbi:Outer membrane receptor proteins, mostly Fe transport [Parasphingorhabdus marina DSM 22363]|uniref:Outer membrane receptor proteins, mostly Fe transport n=1 Tax=Parasphingorhabdus marina DSM 22363 TaxID=1123272 RepID=A0A1N6GS65_9SPHN|nr:TonB-dependent receptor [Parasphingorhabdus marina]SIO10359.1 Outer membrane receptor proteins, mostly Fe transport [Parasphingorhabdus marina DSM 22363]
MKNIIACSASVITLAIAATSSAQAADATSAQTEQSGGDTENRDDNIIIVTGQKFEQSLQEVTSSVSVTTAEDITREPITDLYDIVDRIPNVTSSFGGLGFAIRGIDQRGIAGGGATLTIYVDDSPLDNQTTFFGPLDSWDLGQVEIYRGPQSTNFGRNALAGAIYVRTQDPTYEWDIRARGEIGDNGQRQIAGAFGGPIVEDSLAFRVSANYRESDGFIFNTFLDEQADATELKTIRLKLLMEPADNFKIITTSSYTENFAGEDSVNPLSGQQADGSFDAGSVAREVSYDFAGLEGTDTFIQSINLQLGLADGLDLQSISTYQDTDYVRREDFDNSPASLGFLDRQGADETFSQELRLKYQSDRIKALLGFYYFDNQNVFDDDFIISAGILGPIFPSSILISRAAVNTADTRNYAFFTDGEFALTDTIDLLFGLRYDNEETNTLAVATTAIANPPLPALPPFVEQLLVSQAGTTSQEVGASFEAWLPKGGIRWSPNEDFNLSFVAQRAYRAGGAQIFVVDGSINEFEPEYLWNYEIAMRSTWLDGRLKWNANVYYSDWSDQQVSIPVPAFPTFGLTQNAGQSTLYGFETDISFEITPEFEIYGGLGYAFTEFDDFPNGNFDSALPESEANQANFAGNRFPFAPRWSANAGVAYNSEFGLFGGIDANFQSKVFQGNENLGVNYFGDRVLVNARIGYEILEGVRASAYVRNLFDEQYFTSLSVGSPGDEFSRLGAERTFAVRLDLDF